MQFRDLMAPDTDPTDEELALVAQEMLQLVRERRAKSDKRLAETLRQASIDAEASMMQRRLFKDDGK